MRKELVLPPLEQKGKSVGPDDPFWVTKVAILVLIFLVIFGVLIWLAKFGYIDLGF